MSEEYEVGYGKPPQAGQFTKGQSGNPNGRPKGSKNMATLFREISQELIHITENGQTKTVTRIEAVLRQMTSRAMSGEPRVMREFIHLSRTFEDIERAGDKATEPDERETFVLQSVLNRLRQMADRNEAGDETEPKNDLREEEE